MTVFKYLALSICILLLPSIALGVIRKLKARMQNRIGAPILQPLFDILKLLNKNQTISETTTWIFPLSSVLNLAVMLLIAFLVPWLSFKPNFSGDDLFLLLYMLALLRFMIILSALDTGSAFGAFGASREAYVAMLTEPAIFLSLVALGLMSHSSSLSTIFAFSRTCSIYDAPVWLSAALALFLASIADLSRMPIDDPTTHLELTMVHEAMILENSGKNLALVEFAHLLKMVVLYGLSVQCLLHATTCICQLSESARGILSIVGILSIASITAIIEAVSVKLQWRRTPEFIAYVLTISLFAVAAALIGGLYAHHGI